MKFKRIVCLISAAVMAFCSLLPASAEEEDERIIEDYWENEEMMTDDTSAPTLSFDLTDWKNSIHMTTDASLISLEAKSETEYAYQGKTMKLTASSAKDIDQLSQYSWLIRDDNNELVYPESENEDYEFLTMGIELHANEFGMNYFDGSLITFNYRINPDAQGLLMGDSCFVFPCTDGYERLDSTELRLQYNDTDSNNTTQYANGVLSIAEDIGANKLIIMVPLIKQTDAIDILYIDNFTITTQTGKRVANIDGYNENAQAQEIVQGLKVKKKDNTVDLSKDEDDSVNVKTVIIYVVVVLIVAAVIVGIIFLVRRMKNKFY